MIIAAALLAVILIGEVIVYTSNTNSFVLNAEHDGSGGVDYSVSISGSQPYQAIVMENGMQTMTELYIFYDPGYASDYQIEIGPIGSKPLDQNNYINMFMTSLESASGMPVRIMSAEELRTAMSDDVGSGDTRKGLLVISGALPDVIYTGSSADLIFQWLGGGGRLYWAGNILGKYYSTTSGLVDVPATTEYQKLFFGMDCLNTDTSGDGFVSNDFTGGPTADLRYDLSIKNNRIKYGVDTTILDSNSVNYRAFGYSDDANRYASIVLTEYTGGKGMICVLAGDYSRNQRSDLVQVISSGVDHSTNILGTADGSLRYGTCTGEIDVGPLVPNMTAYIYLGGYYQVYGRLFVL
jgi:hypothetical protein